MSHLLKYRVFKKVSKMSHYLNFLPIFVFTTFKWHIFGLFGHFQIWVFFLENVKKIRVFTWCLEPGFVVHWHWIHLARDSRRPFFSLWLIVTRSPVGGMVRLASHYSKVPNKHTCPIRIFFQKITDKKFTFFFLRRKNYFNWFSWKRSPCMK